MMIKSIEIDNHPILGNLAYNFEEGKPITLLISENGSGKTRLMEFIYILLDKGFRVWEIDEWESGSTSRIKLCLQLTEDECNLLPKITITKEGQEPQEKSINGDIYLEATQKIRNFNAFKIYSLDEETGTYIEMNHTVAKSLEEDKPFAKLMREKVRFSSVEINYAVPKVERPGAFNIDEDVQTKSPKNLAEVTADLLVSLSLEDDRVFRKENGSVGSVVKRFDGKFDRFKTAYNTLFSEGVELLGVEIENKEYVVKFRNLKTRKVFPLKGLSSGQQQVVYRVGYLLQNINISAGGVVFIDEPELSLHPYWQERYLDFLLSLFGDKVQFIIATHSPYIVKSAIANASISISKISMTPTKLMDEKLSSGSKLSKPTLAEVSYRAFGMISEEFHIELYLELQQRLAPSKFDSTTQKYIGGLPANLDTVLKSSAYNIPVHKTWTDINSGKLMEETIMTFVRNCIHHGPDSVARGRAMYSEQELKKSIEDMLVLL